MKKIALYYHGGSKNHGCEAIARSSYKLLKNFDLTLFSFMKDDDLNYHLDSLMSLEQLGSVNNHSKKTTLPAWKNLKAKIRNNLPEFLVHYYKRLSCLPIKEETIFSNYNLLFNHPEQDLYISIGGDNYCYPSSELESIARILKARGCRIALWGCSVEPRDITLNKGLVSNLKLYDLITTRESLTYNAMIKAGINKNTHLIPDPAFLLDSIIPDSLPKEFIPHNTVGINLSPLVQNLEKKHDITYKNVTTLVRYILNDTNMSIAFIPHVTWDNSNDLEPLVMLYRQFKDSNRVCLIDQHYNCMELKGVISLCRFMLAARTHASIAAYSSQVPTLVIAYSVKARGIAQDIFGTEKGYVIPVQNLKEEIEITGIFKNLILNEPNIRKYYKELIPSYIKKTWQATEEVNKLLR